MSPEVNSVFSNLLSYLKSADNQPAAELKLAAGQRIQARVISAEGEQYLLQSGDNKFYALAESALEIGGKMLLEVLGQKEGVLLLKRLEQLPEESGTDPLKLLLKKFGISAEKDILRIREALQEVPLERLMAARYLVDPHLLAALLLPSLTSPEDCHKFEIYGYKNSQNTAEVYEIVIELELERLGHVEITIKAVERLILTRIWAASPETAREIRDKITELGELQVELIPVKQGPLIVRELVKNVDIRI